MTDCPHGSSNAAACVWCGREAALRERDEWREKAERLEGEVAALYEERASYRRLSGGDQLDLNFKIHQRCEQLQRSLISAQEDVAHWEEENDGLRAALEKYGRHQGDCLPWDNPQRPFICSCGLDDALENK